MCSELSLKTKFIYFREKKLRLLFKQAEFLFVIFQVKFLILVVFLQICAVLR